MAKQPRIVAELGRPETAEETAARKAENSRKHRANQTVRNLVLALVASLGVMLVLVLVVVRPDQPPREAVDYAGIAERAQPSIGEPLAVPALPPEWAANSATLEVGSDGITNWSIGFITPAQQFIGFRQGVDATDTWVANQLENSEQTGEEQIDGVLWSIHDNRNGEDPGNLAYALSASAGSGRYVLYGTASDIEFRTIAAALAVEIEGAATETEVTETDSEG